MAIALARPWMKMSVARRRGVDAMPPRVSRMRGMASPTKGIAGCSKSRRVVCGAGSAVGVEVGPIVGAAVGASVDVGVGAVVGVGVGIGEGAGV